MDPNMSSNSLQHDRKWIRMFPASVSEKDASAKFLIRSMFVAFSVIIKRRELLDAACFATNHITDNLKATTLSFQNPTSEKISQLLRSAGEALKEGYLKEIALVITENPMEDVALEVYTFRVHYDEQGFPTAVLGMNSEEGQGAVNSNVNLQKVAKFDFRGTASVRDQLVLLVKSLHALTQKILKPLPEKRSFNLRLEYMPHTPDTKSVSGFTDADHFYTPHNDMQIATIGHLRPGHHAALLDCNSVFIEDSFGAETTLKRYNDVFAKDLESASVLQHNELYSSFADESNAKIPEVTAERSEPEDGSEDKLATTIGNMDLDASQSTPKDVKRGGKRARRHQKPSAHPYS